MKIILFLSTNSDAACLKELLLEVNLANLYFFVGQIGNIKLIEADHLWRKDTHETTDLLKKGFCNDINVSAIGQAGGSLVIFACPVADYYYASAGVVWGA